VRTTLRRRSRWAAGLALGLLLAPVPPSRAAEETPAGDRFKESIEVSVVNLDVFVTDKKGQPLTGLKKEDFQVFEDGKPVEISNFYAESRGPAPQAAGAKEERPVQQQLRLVVLVDDFSLSSETRGRILPKVSDFLQRELVPGDQVMIVRYDQSLSLLRPFTSDLGQVRSDLSSLLTVSSDLRKRRESLEQAVEDVIGSMEGDIYEPILVENRIMAWGEQESAVVRGSLQALDSVVSWLAGVPGRKAILYVSDGLPLAPGEDLFAAFAQGNHGVVGGSLVDRITPFKNQSLELSERFRQTTAHAGRNGITLYPIEAYGVRNTRPTRSSNAAVQSRQNGLRLLAQETGGKALLNATDPLAALQPLAEDLTTYYSIGYQPQRMGDEVEHKIEVKVKARGAQVRYRQWYRDKPVGEAVAEATTAVMRFGPEDNPLGAALEVSPGKQPGETLVRIKVPVAKLFLQPNGASRQGQLRLYVVVGGEGSTTPVRQTKLVTVEVPEPEAAAGSKREYAHEISIPLKPGSYSIGVGVRDELAATTSYLRRDFVAGMKDPSAR
jgi:VWFA-related protein